MRQSWVVKLKPGCGAEYKKRHDYLWPEMLRPCGATVSATSLGNRSSCHGGFIA